jgi:hypothetical protein
MELIVGLLTALFTGLTVLTMLRPNIGFKVSKRTLKNSDLLQLEIKIESDKPIEIVGFKINDEVMIYRTASMVPDGCGHPIGWVADSPGSAFVTPVGELVLFKDETARFSVWIDSHISLDAKRISLIARSSNFFWRITRTVEIP